MLEEVNDKFDVIGIHATSPEYSYGIACDLANIYDKNYRYKSDRFVYPFDELSFKNISDIADIFSVLKTNYNIKLFNKLNDEFKGDKLDLICENGMQEVYDLGSKISKKCHDIMIMEIIYKEQLRNYEEAKEYEESDMSNKKLNVSKYCVETSQKQENDFEQDLDSHGFQPKLRR